MPDRPQDRQAEKCFENNIMIQTDFPENGGFVFSLIFVGIFIFKVEVE